MGASLPPKKPPPAPSIIPVRLLPFCRNVNTVALEAKGVGGPGATAAPCAGLHRPVMPEPVGTSCSQPATCGRRVAVFDAIVTLAVASPGEVASTVTLPEVLVDWANAMQRPEKAFRDMPLSDSWLVGSPLPVPISLPSPETRNVTSFSVTGTTRPCASCTSTANTATSSPSAEISFRSAASTSFAAGPVVSRLAVITCLPSLYPRASIAPGVYLTFHARCESFFMSLVPRLWPLRNSSTRSRFECTQTAISWPSNPGQFQCGNRCSTGFDVHHAWK